MLDGWGERMKSVLIALLLASSVAVADGINEVSATDTKAWLGLFDKIVDAVVTHRADCPTMAGDLNAIIGANQETIRVVRGAKASGKQLPQAAQQHMLDGARRMMASLDKCGRDQGVAAAFARVDLSGRSGR